MEFKEEILLEDTFADDDSDGDAEEVVPAKTDKEEEEEVDEFGLDEDEVEE